MEKMIVTLERWLNKICTYASYINILIVLVVTFEVASRYIFNNPTTWSWVVNQHLFGVMVLFGGIYAFLTNSHIRIEIFYNHFPPAVKTFTMLMTLLFFSIFMVALMWKGGLMAYKSIVYQEVARGLFPMPIYPLKTLIPAISLIFFIIGLIHILREKR